MTSEIEFDPDWDLEWAVGPDTHVRFDSWIEVDPVPGAKRTWELDGEIVGDLEE